MKIVHTYASEYCPNGIDCAKVHGLSDGDLLVRGYKLRARARTLRAGQDAVRIPAEVYRSARAALGDRLERVVIGRHRDGDTLIRGSVITDHERASLTLPDHEDAVRVTGPTREEAPA